MNSLAVDIRQYFFRDSDTFPTETGQVGGLVSAFMSNAIVLAGIILLFLLFFGGFSYISGAGKSDPQRAAQGKAAITAAIIGFLLIFFSYWIIKAVELMFGMTILP
jgi:hypothetical protein